MGAPHKPVYQGTVQAFIRCIFGYVRLTKHMKERRKDDEENEEENRKSVGVGQRGDVGCYGR